MHFAMALKMCVTRTYTAKNKIGIKPPSSKKKKEKKKEREQRKFEGLKGGGGPYVCHRMRVSVLRIQAMLSAPGWQAGHVCGRPEAKSGRGAGAPVYSPNPVTAWV